MPEQPEGCPPGVPQGSAPPLPFRQRGIYVVMLLAGVLVVLLLAWALRWVLTLTFAAIMLAVFLRTGADLLAWLLRRFVKIGQGQSLALFGFVLVIVASLFGVVAVPALLTEFNKLRRELPEAVRDVQDQIRQTDWGPWVLEALPTIPDRPRDGGQAEGRTNSPQSTSPPAPIPEPWEEINAARPAPESQEGTDQPPQDSEDQGRGDAGQARVEGDEDEEDEEKSADETDAELTIAGVAAPEPQAVARHAATALGTVTMFLVAVLFILFAGIYMAANPGLYCRGILWLIPPRGRKKADCVLRRVGKTLQYWLVGQLISMALVGVLTGVGLWILGAPMPLVFGVLAGLLEFIPNLGPVIAGGLPVLLSFTGEGRFFDGPTLALAVLIYFMAIQSLEAYVITPMVQQRAVELPPALLIFTQLSAAMLLGPVGVLIAAPLVASIMAASKELFVVGEPGHEHPKDRAHEGDH